MTSHWLRGLNPEQQQAVLHNRGPMLILAGAGSGKTTVLVSRTGRLIEEKICSPQKLCVLTFTNKAARELKTRVASKLGPIGSKIYAGTFHSFGLMLLKKFHKETGLLPDFSILDATDSAHLIKEILQDYKGPSKTTFEVEKLAAHLSRWREDGRKTATREDPYEQATEWLLPRYERRLQLLGALDFDSLLLKPLELMKSPEISTRIQSQFDFVMVDEFQDTNKVQMKLIMKLAEKHLNLAVVGDDDQSIYGWRGACVRNILDFPKQFKECHVVRLEKNYRSNPQILALANLIIAKNDQRHKKILRPTKETHDQGLPELFNCENEDAEAEFIGEEIGTLIQEGAAPSEIAVLYRSNGQGALIEGELRKKRIPYVISGGTALFDRKETRDALSFLRTALFPTPIHLKRIINTPPRGLGDRSLELLDAHSQSLRGDFFAAARSWRNAHIDEKAGMALDLLFQKLDSLKHSIIYGQSSAGKEFLGMMDALGYRQFILRNSSDQNAAQSKWRLLELFAHILDKFIATGGRTLESIRDFIDVLELRDGHEDEKSESVQLMTLHACKGLEFPYVFLIGVEEDILPHRTLGTDISEERRLFYVGVTRAEKQLILTHTRERKRYGRAVPVAPSRFITELPDSVIKRNDGGRALSDTARRAMLEQFLNS